MGSFFPASPEANKSDLIVILTFTNVQSYAWKELNFIFPLQKESVKMDHASTLFDGLPVWAGTGFEGVKKRGKKVIKKFDSFQNQCKNFSQKTGKFLIPIKYRNCYFFSVS